MDQRTLLYRCSELLVLILSWLPLLGFASELFQHRRQWESFAGNADLTYLLGMHPIHYWIGIPLAILLLQSWWARHCSLSCKDRASIGGSCGLVWFP